MASPAGDHLGTPIVTAGSRSYVICLARVPSVRTTHRFACPPLSERYTSSEPSGLTDGVCTCPVCFVTLVICRVFSAGEPATGHFQISDSLRMRDTARRPEACRSGSTNDTSPDVICESPEPSSFTTRRLKVGGYGIVLPADELKTTPDPSGSQDAPRMNVARARGFRSPPPAGATHSTSSQIVSPRP